MRDERELLALMKEGDEAAFKGIFELYVKRVYQFVYGYLKNKPDAEDVTQIVFKKLWESRFKVQEQSSVNNLLFTIAYNATIDQIRQNSYQQKTSAMPNENSFSIPEETGYTSSRKVLSLYEASVNLLPPKRKEVYLLSRHEGLTNKQIAERLNISIKTVEHQLSAAMDFLRAYFRNLEE